MLFIVQTRFIETIRSATGGAPAHEVLVPGKMIRFATSDRRGDLSGWCKLFVDNESGVFGCWRQGISDDWHSRKNRTPEEQAAFLVQMKQAKAEAASIEAELRAKCQEKSAKLWEKGRDVEARHHYLAAKNIKPYGTRHRAREHRLLVIT